MEMKTGGKTVIVTDAEKREVRAKLKTGASWDVFTEKERMIGFELGREETLRWYKSNADATFKREIAKKVRASAKSDDPAKRKAAEEYLKSIGVDPNDL